MKKFKDSSQGELSQVVADTTSIQVPIIQIARIPKKKIYYIPKTEDVINFSNMSIQIAPSC